MLQKPDPRFAGRPVRPKTTPGVWRRIKAFSDRVDDWFDVRASDGIVRAMLVGLISVAIVSVGANLVLAILYYTL